MRNIIFLSIFLVVHTAMALAGGNTLEEWPFPEGVHFGQSRNSLGQIRREVKFSEISSGNGLFAAVEGYYSGAEYTGYVYHFTDDKLGAVLYTRISTNAVLDAETTRLYRSLTSSPGRLSKRQIARAGQIRNVSCLALPDTPVEICFEGTTRGTSITFFSTELFSFDDIFPNVTNLTVQSDIIAKYRKAQGGSTNQIATETIDRLDKGAPSSVRLVP